MPDELVVCLAGDGSLVMNCQELATAVEHDIDVKVFIMNNGYLGMVRQWQELFWDKRYSRGRHGHEPRLGEARRGVRRDRHARRRRTTRSTTRCARRSTPRAPVVLDVQRAPRGELLPDDPGRRAPPGTWWADAAWVSQGPKEVLRLEDLEAAGNIRTGRKHVLSVLVENKAGRADAHRGPVRAARVQHRHARGRADRGPESVSRMTITLDGAAHPIDQVTKQLHKLVNVIKIRDLEPRGDDRARDGAVQGLRRRPDARRDHAARGHLPGPDHRRLRAARSRSR